MYTQQYSVEPTRMRRVRTAHSAQRDYREEFFVFITLLQFVIHVALSLEPQTSAVLP